MSKVIQNNKATVPLGRVELFCLFVACSSYATMEATVLSCRFSWVWSACPKFSKATNYQHLWKGLYDFADFLQVVICILLDIHWSYTNMLFWAGIVRYSLSGNQIVRCFKLKKLKKDMRYQIDFLVPLKLEEICYYGLWPQNTFGQSVCRIFYFWLVWRVKLDTRGPLLHCTCFICDSYFDESCFKRDLKIILVLLCLFKFR